MTAETQPSVSPTLKQRFSRLKRWQRWLVMFAGFCVAWPVVMTIVYAVVPPPVTNIMILRLFSGNGIHKKWVPLSQISPYLPKAVITSEDARFCDHNGVDWIELNGVVEDVFDDEEGPIRGASTIPMQLAKNVFLWDGRNPIRKGLEIPIAYWMDLVLSKKRLIELYLNEVEWAPGIYGAEAASQFHFKKPAAKLSRREAALLAAVLPNPIKRKAGKPSRGVNMAAARIQRRMVGMGGYLTCLD